MRAAVLLELLDDGLVHVVEQARGAESPSGVVMPGRSGPGCRDHPPRPGRRHCDRMRSTSGMRLSVIAFRADWRGNFNRISGGIESPSEKKLVSRPIFGHYELCETSGVGPAAGATVRIGAVGNLGEEQ